MKRRQFSRFSAARRRGHSLRQRVQAEEQKTKSQDGKHHNDGHEDHKDIGLTRRGDERRQMMGRGRVKWLSPL
jgi:hypothetical protein